jgi:hypothetical protein
MGKKRQKIWGILPLNFNVLFCGVTRVILPETIGPAFSYIFFCYLKRSILEICTKKKWGKIGRKTKGIFGQKSSKMIMGRIRNNCNSKKLTSNSGHEFK